MHFWTFSPFFLTRNLRYKKKGKPEKYDYKNEFPLLSHSTCAPSNFKVHSRFYVQTLVRNKLVFKEIKKLNYWKFCGCISLIKSPPPFFLFIFLHSPFIKIYYILVWRLIALIVDKIAHCLNKITHNKVLVSLWKSNLWDYCSSGF